MIKADSEEHFEKAYSNARLILRQQQPRNAELEATLDEFANANAEYSQFAINKMAGSRGLHGSSVSEQNHSSTLCHLNDGHSKDNQYCEEPITYVKDLFGRQQKLNTTMNEILFDAKLQMSIEREHLMHDEDSWRKVQLLKALDYLCLPEYTRFKANLKIAEEDLHIEEINGKSIITSIKSHPKISTFDLMEDKCQQCNVKIAFMCQCAHEIKLRRGFCASDFLPMHMQRDRVSGSLTGWECPTNYTTSELLSINAESIDSDGINISDSLVGNPDDDNFAVNPELVNFDMNNGIASENAEHVFDLTKKTVKTLDNRSLRSILNDVSTFYEKADRKVQMVVGAMSIQMRNLLAEGRKNADSTTFDLSKSCETSISQSMVNIVETYQSSFSSKSSFATTLNTNMTVSKPTRSLISGAGKQRFKRRKETNSILETKKAKMRTLSTVGNMNLGKKINQVANAPRNNNENVVDDYVIPVGERKNPPELEANFTEIVMGVNQKKKILATSVGIAINLLVTKLIDVL